MTSHTEYIADQDEEQLRHLIEVASARLENIKNGGWVMLWVVADYANQGWFAMEDYVKAIEFMGKLAQKHIAKGNQYGISIDDHRFRPDEAKNLIEETRVRRI